MIECLNCPIDKYPYFLFFNRKTISRASLFNWIIDFKMILPFPVKEYDYFIFRFR